MAAHSIYVGKSVGVGSGSRPLCGLENRRPKGYVGSSPVPSATSFEKLGRFAALSPRPACKTKMIESGISLTEGKLTEISQRIAAYPK